MPGDALDKKTQELWNFRMQNPKSIEARIYRQARAQANGFKDGGLADPISPEQIKTVTHAVYKGFSTGRPDDVKGAWSGSSGTQLKKELAIMATHTDLQVMQSMKPSQTPPVAVDKQGQGGPKKNETSR